MKRRTRDENSPANAMTGRIDEACSRYSLGKSTMRNVAEKAGAVIKIGRVVLVNYQKVDDYMNSISE